MSTAPITILDALADPALFAPWFQSRSTWATWRAFLASLFGLPITGPDLELYRRHTGRTAPMREPAREGWVVVGRRGGKSRVASSVAVYLATCRDYERFLAPGERATVMLIAADRAQARTCFRYVEGLLRGVPMLESMIERSSADTIDLTNRVSIEIRTASYRTLRGYTVAAAVLDEVAFWRSDDSQNPDTEIVNGLRPAMATIPGSLLLAISSPYARRGVLWQAYKSHFAKEGDPVLVWQAPSLVMNSSLDPAVIQAAYEEDDASARAEYGAEFRKDIEAFVAREALDGVTVPGRLELPPVSDVTYRGFCDPSGGSVDSMTLAIAHEETCGDRRISVLDLMREVKPPFSPERAVEDFSETLKQYGIRTISGDRYGGLWPSERFEKHGIAYSPSEVTRSEIYLETLPLLNNGTCELLDSKRLQSQLLSLERRTSRAGRDSIDHGPGGHDDLCNAAMGALWLAHVAERGRIALACVVDLTRRRKPIDESIFPWERELEGRAPAGVVAGPSSERVET